MEKSDIFIIKVNVSENPWVSSYKEFEFSRKKLSPITDKIVELCSNKKYTASYQYGNDVSKAIEDFWDNSCGSVIPLYKALILLLSEKINKSLGWHDGATAAIRVLNTRIAYATPGFIEAKRYNELYGS